MASIIDPELAKSLIAEFQKQNISAAGLALKTPDSQFLNGFFVDRQCLENILSNKTNVGMSISFAKHPDFVGKPDNIFTIVCTGAEPDADPGATSPYKSSGDVYDFMPPCPPWCTNII